MNIQPLPIRSAAAAISLARCWLDDDRDIDLAAARSLLSAAEDIRARRFHFDRDRNRYVRGRGFLRCQLGRATGQAAADLVLAEGLQGKPFLQGNAVWFNLSHSRDLAVLAISHDGPLGIDLEFVDRAVDIAGLAQSCFCPHEIEILDALSPAARPGRFFAFWTAKEACMKLTGEGMALAPRMIALNLKAGLPVGYLRPTDPAAQAMFVDLGQPHAICCLALAQGPRPAVTLLKNRGNSRQGWHVAD